MGDSGVDLAMPELERDFDLEDLLVANALDVFGLLGCNSFSVWGDEVEGGGVLTGRNFDWPLSGAHLLYATMLLVEHLPDGRATASVTWPGYVGAVTGISKAGLAAFLHVGWQDDVDNWSPIPGRRRSRCGACSSRAARMRAAASTAQQLLGNTSPPAGYLLHVVLPRVPAGSSPALASRPTRSRACAASARPAPAC